MKCCADPAGQVDPRLVNGKLTLQGESPWQVRGSSPGPRGTEKGGAACVGGRGRRVLKALKEERTGRL